MDSSCLLSHIDVATIVLFVAVFLLGRLWVKSWMEGHKNIPPFPAKPYPILGHLPYMKKNPRKTLAEWAKKQTGIFSLYFGSKLVVVASDFETTKEMYIKHADAFSDRPPSVFDGGSVGILSASGPVWEEQRAVSNVILRQFGMGKNDLANRIQEEVKVYLDELGKAKGKPQEIRTLTNTSISNNICSIIIGKRFEYDDPEFKKLIYLLQESFRLTASTSVLGYFPILKYLPGDLFSFKKAIHIVNTFRFDFINEYVKKSHVQVETSDDNDNFITAYLREKKHREEKGLSTTMSDMNLRACMSSLFIAGSETTATVILWFMMYMIHYPKIQSKVHQEIMEVAGQSRLPNMSDKPHMNYLNACILETLRIASMLPMSVPHITNADAKIRGYFIPKGTRIINFLDGILLDEGIWGDPLVFRPERFFAEDGSVVTPEEFVPFSLGRRVCLGEPLAKTELFLYCSALIQRFELLLPSPDNLPPLEGEFGVSCPPKSFEIRFVERNL